MRWYSIAVDDEPSQVIAASDMVGAVIWVWDHGFRKAKTILIREVEEPADARRS